MAEFCIEIAGRVAAVCSLFDSTKDYCRQYLSQKAPDFSITVSREDMIFEQDAFDEEARLEGFRLRKFTDPYLERTAIQRKLAEALFASDVLMIHGSAVAVDGESYLFMARSGTGKSTHTRFWRESFGSRAVMINDDKPFLRFTEQGSFLCGSPWSGKHGLDSNVTAPLKGICLLQRGAENRIAPASAQDLLPMLEKQVYCPLDEGHLPRYRELITRLAEETPLWQMECTKEPQAACISWEAMSGNNAEKDDNR